MAKRYTSIRLILDKIMRHPLMSNLSFETAVDYTVDFMRIVGCPAFFEDKTSIVNVTGYKASLPDDFHELTQARSIDGSSMIMYRATTDTFHTSELGKNPSGAAELTYKIQGHTFMSSVKEDVVELSYKAFATDDLGYILIPDNSEFTRALELHIKKEWFTILFETGVISNQSGILQNIKQDYAWAVGACASEFNRLSIDEMEALANSFNTMIPRNHEHSNGFINNGSKEVYFKH